MRSLWLVAKHEYLKQVRKRSFLLATLGFPLIIVVVSAVSALVVIRGGDARPVGYVDLAEVLDAGALRVLQAERRRFPDFIAFAESVGAHAALEAGELQAYYVLPEDYLSRRELTVVYADKEPGEAIVDGFGDLIRASLVAAQPTEVQPRLSEGFDLVVNSGDGRRQLRESNLLDFLVPFVLAFFMFFAIANTGGYMLAAVTEEKTNRTMELLATSVSPFQLMGGKALGLIGVSFTQLLVWVVGLMAAAVVAARFYPQLQGTAVPWTMLGLSVLFFVPTFALISGIMISIGAMVTELREGQQMSGILNQLFVMPVYFGAIFVSNPSSPFLRILTLFPTTSMISILLRWSTGSVPVSELIVSWVLLVGAATVSVWLSGKILRVGMLRYGQRLRLRAVIAALRGHPPVNGHQEAPSNA